MAGAEANIFYLLLEHLPHVVHAHARKTKLGVREDYVRLHVALRQHRVVVDLFGDFLFVAFAVVFAAATAAAIEFEAAARVAAKKALEAVEVSEKVVIALSVIATAATTTVATLARLTRRAVVVVE